MKKRWYIVELFDEFGKRWIPSGNDGIRGLEFETKPKAEQAIIARGGDGITYRVIEMELPTAVASRVVVSEIVRKHEVLS